MNFTPSANQKPHPDGTWVDVVAHIRKNATGEIVKESSALLLHHGESLPNTFIWIEGNYSCDCNRGLFFRDPDYVKAFEDDDDTPHCSNGLFSVNLENPANGEIFYREFETNRNKS